MVFIVKQFRSYGQQFSIVIDHWPLQWLINLKDTLSKLARWLFRTVRLKYCYKPAVLNSNVDALSRMYPIDEIKENNYEKCMDNLGTIFQNTLFVIIRWSLLV